MQVTGIRAQANNNRSNKVNNRPQNINFGTSFVTVARKNSGEFLRDEIVKPFNASHFKETLKETLKNTQEIINSVTKKTPGKIKTAEDLQTKVNSFSLAAGKGSRFEELAVTSGNEPNKVAVKFPINEKESLSMLDVTLASANRYAGKEGHEVIMAEEKSGSLGDVIKHYLAGNEIKDTVIRCGDNAFGDKSDVIDKFLIETINNPNKHLGLVGVELKPQETVGKFAVFKVEPQKGKPDVMSLIDSKEKPKTEAIAKQYATPQGTNIAQTGVIYYSKEAMTKLVDKIKKGDNPIKKDDVEQFDFAFAVEHIHKNMDELGVKPSEGADVKVIKKWEDVGEPEAYYNWKDQMAKTGDYLKNFSERFAKKAQKAIKEKTRFDGPNKVMVFDKTIKSVDDVPAETMAKAPVVDGVKIIPAKD